MLSRMFDRVNMVGLCEVCWLGQKISRLFIGNFRMILLFLNIEIRENFKNDYLCCESEVIYIYIYIFSILREVSLRLCLAFALTSLKCGLTGRNDQDNNVKI